MIHSFADDESFPLKERISSGETEIAEWTDGVGSEWNLQVNRKLGGGRMTVYHFCTSNECRKQRRGFHTSLSHLGVYDVK